MVITVLVYMISLIPFNDNDVIMIMLLRKKDNADDTYNWVIDNRYNDYGGNKMITVSIRLL